MNFLEIDFPLVIITGSHYLRKIRVPWLFLSSLISKVRENTEESKHTYKKSPQAINQESSGA